MLKPSFWLAIFPLPFQFTPSIGGPSWGDIDCCQVRTADFLWRSPCLYSTIKALRWFYSTDPLISCIWAWDFPAILQLASIWIPKARFSSNSLSFLFRFLEEFSCDLLWVPDRQFPIVFQAIWFFSSIILPLILLNSPFSLPTLVHSSFQSLGAHSSSTFHLSNSSIFRAVFPTVLPCHWAKRLHLHFFWVQQCWLFAFLSLITTFLLRSHLMI